jgi:XTP/dITP diphosphohydrolase
MEIVVATFNQDKLKEIIEITKNYPHNFISLKDWAKRTGTDVQSVDEDGDTFEENSLLKAKAALEVTGLPSIADDTGLVVPALNGEPGIFSSRYALTEAEMENLSKDEVYSRNNQKLLKELAKKDSRDAYFICVATLCLPDGRVLQAEGRCLGEIAQSPKMSKGFGYDPLFVVDKDKCLSELTMVEKNEISHRGRAIKNLFDSFSE